MVFRATTTKLAVQRRSFDVANRRRDARSSHEAIKISTPANAPRRIRISVFIFTHAECDGTSPAGVCAFSLMTACKRNLFHTVMQGAYMMTANPMRQMVAPMLSNRSGQELSTAHPQRSDSIVNMPP